MTTKNKDSRLNEIYVTRTNGFLDVSQKKEIFNELSKSFNGKFTIKHTSDYTLEILNVSIPFKNRSIEMTESDTRPLRFQASFDAIQNFNLLISPKEILDRIIEKFVKPKIELGQKDFDNHFVIKSNRSDLTKMVISNEIQNYLIKYNVYSVSVETDQKLKKINLLSVIGRTLDDKKSYEDMITLHQLLIDGLDREKIIKE